MLQCQANSARSDKIKIRVAATQLRQLPLLEQIPHPSSATTRRGRATSPASALSETMSSTRSSSPQSALSSSTSQSSSSSRPQIRVSQALSSQPRSQDNHSKSPLLDSLIFHTCQRPSQQKIQPKIAPSPVWQSFEQTRRGVEIEGFGVSTILGDLIEI